MEVQAIREAAKKKTEFIRKGTLGALILAYKASIEFSQLADRTKQDYRNFMKDLEKLKGLILAELTTPDVMTIRDKIAKQRTNDRANRVKNFLSTLLKWGKPRGHITHNPAEDVPNIRKTQKEKAQKANRPWTKHELSNFLEQTYPEMRTAIALAAWTSLREQDVIRIPWTAITNGWINWRHNKTGVIFECLVSSELQQILKNTRKSAVTIVTGKKGNSFVGEDGFRTNFNKERNRIATLGLIGKDCTFHGLRHTILTEAANEGATTAEIMSLSGHKTESQVRRYTNEARRKKSAEKIMNMLESRNKE